MGRDKLWKLLREHNLLIRKRKSYPKTTNSKHWMKKYPNLIKELSIGCAEQVWVSDITYISIGNDFYYLSLITDAYSRKIMGYHLHPFLNTEGCLKALDMALSERTKMDGLIHHSDRGTQYCSFDYIMKLKENNIEISMTENGDPYENAIAERINGILKTEFRLNRIFKTYMEALLAVKTSTYNYNTLRPHMSCNLLTPQEAHFTDGPLVRHWKSKYKKAYFSGTTPPLCCEGGVVPEKHELN